MTSRTHDLAAFTALTLTVAYIPILPTMTVATAITAFGANMIGGLLPDIDDATSDFWDKIPGGSLLGKIVHPLLGNHRMVSHSILGMSIAGMILHYVLTAAKSFILVDMQIIWWAIMIGYASHLIMDSLTKEGVPWLFPIPVRIGFPPFRFLRVKTGGLFEKSIVFPGLVILTGYIIYIRYPLIYTFITTHLLR